MTRQEGEPTDNLATAESTETAAEGVVAGPESRSERLTLAIRQLLDALDRCAGDPPDCPHCDPARRFALDLLKPDPGQPEPATSTEQERVRLSGRAGADPSFRTTPNGTLVGRFPLAVRDGEKPTAWFPVLAFNQRAEQLREIVKRGAALDVVGYLHPREVRSREGKTRTVQEIYAVTVKTAGTTRRGAR